MGANIKWLSEIEDEQYALIKWLEKDHGPILNEIARRRISDLENAKGKYSPERRRVNYHSCKPVACKATGEVYQSIAEVAEFAGIHRNTVASRLRRNTETNYYFV